MPNPGGSEAVSQARTAPQSITQSSDSENFIEMTDEELAAAAMKVRRKRLVTSPSLSVDDIKRLRSQSGHKASSSNSSS